MNDKTAKNDITGDFIVSKPASDMFEQNFDRIFRQKKKPEETEYELDKSTGEVIKKED